MHSVRSLRRSSLLVAAAVCLFAANAAADVIRVAAQKTGTLSWELDVIRAHGLDREANLTIATLDLASPEAGKIALRGGSADLIVSDWLWVTREDLKGKKLAVAGGAIDKSWLLLQGATKRDGFDLRREANVVYGAPTLLAEKTQQGEMDATLNYWNICAALEAKGFRRLLAIEDILPKLGARGPAAMLGYVFDEAWATRNPDTIARFIDVARKAKEILGSSDAEWERIAPLVGTTDGATLRVYRDRYREGIPRRSIDDEEADAQTLFRVLAAQGGTSLTGGATALAPGTFFRLRSGI
jgi:NitT/TauT family transport system substrate-binding protein